MRKILFATLISVFLFFITSTAVAITGSEIVNNIISSYKQQMEGIKDITIIADNGTNYQKWDTVNGERVCKSRYERTHQGRKFIGIYDGKYHWRKNPMTGEVTKEKIEYNPNVFISGRITEYLKSTKISYKETDMVDGNKRYVLNLPNIGNFIKKTASTMEGMREIKGNGKLWVDANNWVVRKFKADLQVEDNRGKKRNVDFIIKLEDFQEVEGLLIPYRRVTSVDFETPTLSSKQKRQMQKGMERMKKFLNKKSSGGRGRFKGMMESKMKQMQKGMGHQENVSVVEKVKVNTGLSDSLFEGGKL